ncbi:MAG: hypothetical protein QXV22_01900 [Thermoplasmataceae archaeon]
MPENNKNSEEHLVLTFKTRKPRYCPNIIGLFSRTCKTNSQKGYGVTVNPQKPIYVAEHSGISFG